ncbi:MAG: hypothetical protein MUC85_04660 [Anaerolineales bacterium]|jgi:hypothetical protein|nr:hypothetical protein [Anaerolineales bacterium]
MNTNNDPKLHRILNDLAEQAAPAEQIDLWPAIQNSIPASQQPGKSGHAINPSNLFLRRASITLLALIVAAALLLNTSPGRALAERLLLFFHVTEEQSFVIPTDQVFEVPPTSTPAPAYILPLQTVEAVAQLEPTQPVDLSCSTPESRAAYFCQIQAVEELAGFDVKEFLYDPKGTKFSSAVFNAEINQVTQEFVVTTGGGTLHLRQGLNEFLPADDPWSQVPSKAVEQTTVNGNYAEIANGTYVVYPNATAAVWEPGGQLSLVWREENHWYVLEKMGDPYPIEWITEQELIRLAESLVDDRPLDAVPPLDPENLTSVAEAERLAGFDVPTPTLLPQGFELKRVMWVYDTVRLFYGPETSTGSALMIFMGPVTQTQAGPCVDCPPGTSEAVQVGEWQGWYWRGVFHTGASLPSKPAPTPAWQADAPQWQVGWNTDALWISLWFVPTEDGMEMNKDTLIAIAESLR